MGRPLVTCHEGSECAYCTIKRLDFRKQSNEACCAQGRFVRTQIFDELLCLKIYESYYVAAKNFPRACQISRE